MPAREKKARTSIKRDMIHPKDYLAYHFPISCEDCVHFDADKVWCSLGYNPEPHLKKSQQKSFELTSSVAFCRFHEID